MPQVLAAVLRYFPPAAGAASTFVNKPTLPEAARSCSLPESLGATFRLLPQRGAIKYVYATGIGPGAYELPRTASLADAQGMPLESSPSGSGREANRRVMLAAAAATALVGAALLVRRRS